ncbi:TonB-dependent receptor [Chitinophaga vietnamensis]|uniref:TonB-dependent receptor n=1 Tax=Chitinophaga vietnamensis TaxID=2593957 RepID=UPI001178611D|nr:TonB-dependent receptor [Chitinophaga vietnamensis]
MKKLFTLLILLSLALLSHAQHATVKGHVADTLNRTTLSNAVVALLAAKDSMLYKFVRTNEKGQFELKDLHAGKYLVMITYPSFADYVDALTLGDTSVVDFGQVKLTQRSRLLHEVVINQQVGAIKIKGDTTEFNADSFKTAANANVEDLLRKLPGFQVDSKGQITAQGEKVKKVLVDGEEFFGDDPTLVTKNLRADMIDKVQLYDKKSDQAAFTGIDDGEKSKTVNLKLKENKKNGYFGKVEAGAGTEGYHNSDAMFNLFRGKRKFAAYGIVSNTGKTGLNWGEREKFGQSFADNASYDETNGYYFVMGGGDDAIEGWDGRYNGVGYPLVQTGGLHFNNKWNQDKQSVNANVKAMNMGLEENSNTATKNILNNTVQYSNSASTAKREIFRTRANGSYEVQLDSSSSIKVSVDAGLDHKNNHSFNSGSMLNADSAMINSNERYLTGSGDNGSFNSNLLWRKKLRKKGRTISINLSENYLKDNSDGFLNASTEFYSNNKLDSTQHIDQRKKGNSESFNFNSNITYTEPLTKYASLVFNYGLSTNNNHSGRSSFNKDNSGKYAQLDSTYSNDYAFNILTHRGGLSYAYVKKKLRVNFGTNVGFTSFMQEDMFREVKQQRDFVNWYPRASFSYSIGTQRAIMFNYNGNTQQPSINQLQPLRSNEDQLNITIGNPDLKPAFNHSFWMGYRDYKVLTDRSIWLSVSYNITSNAFSNSSTINEKGQRVIQAVNVNGNSHLNFNASLGWKIKPLDLSWGIDANGNWSKNVNFINAAQNITNSTNSTLSLYFRKDKDKKYNNYFRVGPNYTTSTSSVQKDIRTDYWSYELEYNGLVMLPAKFEITSQVNYSIRQKTPVFPDNLNVCLWNAAINKKFGKKDAVMLSLSVNDLLAQNRGINRSVNSNYITQTTYGTIGRYAMLSFLWNFNKMGAGAPKQ